MIYNDFKGIKLSALGMGNMRLPIVDGDNSRIDIEATANMIAFCMQSGINYYDTAYAYHDGKSEIVMGELLKKYDRSSFYLASKFPGYDKNYLKRKEEIFEEQLEKCQVEYFDFYLLHNICESTIDGYLDSQYGLREFLLEQKENGRIRHLGFSAHGEIPCMKQFLDVYGHDMEFGQLQVNYLDYTFQKAKDKIELLKEWNIPVWVMEPVRGGKLARLSEENEQKLAALRPDEKAPAWAFRFLQSLDCVTLTLSGMSNMEQIADNIATFSEKKPLNKEEWDTILAIADEMIKNNTVPCTACRYCVPYCPQGLDIPTLFSKYNEAALWSKGGAISKQVLDEIEEGKTPDCCIACHSCEKVCPQSIQIPDQLKAFADKII